MDEEKLLQVLNLIGEIQSRHAARHAEIWKNYHPSRTTQGEFAKMQREDLIEWHSLKDAGEVEAILSGLTRQEKEAALLMRLPPNSAITLQIPDRWLDTLIRYNATVLLEAQRLKERMSDMPWHATRAEKEGDAYWLRLAGSYQGSK